MYLNFIFGHENNYEQKILNFFQKHGMMPRLKFYRNDN